ncbi:MAG: GreA/GreB family elongation factor [Candidatus Dojkabacteria bacterium]|nr:GreA/GreB family elongation factor [Candidatus Dojkabacteria bacterium]
MTKKRKCKNIKNLEKRLICLKEKYDQLTNQLEETRKSSTSDEGVLEYHQLVSERDLIEKHMMNLEQQLINEEKMQNNNKGKKSTKAEIGSEIILTNSKSKIHFRLVEQATSSEETQISVDSPIGKAVLGKRVGEQIIVKTPKGETHYTIKSLE